MPGPGRARLSPRPHEGPCRPDGHPPSVHLPTHIPHSLPPSPCLWSVPLKKPCWTKDWMSPPGLMSQSGWTRPASGEDTAQPHCFPRRATPSRSTRSHLGAGQTRGTSGPKLELAPQQVSWGHSGLDLLSLFPGATPLTRAGSFSANSTKGGWKDLPGEECSN